MSVKTEEKNVIFPVFDLYDKSQMLSSKIKNLGHFVTDEWCDDGHIKRQYCNLRCPNVKRTLFGAFCTALYSALLFNYRPCTIHRLTVA